MYFGEGIKNKIRELRANGKHDEVKKELLKIRLGKYEKLKLQEKIDVNYYLAWYASADKNRELLNKYLNELKYIFNDKNKGDYGIEYYRYLWLLINSNYEDMGKSEVVDGMIEIHNFYSEIGDENMALVAITNIHAIYGEGDKVLESLKVIMDSRFHVEESVFNSFLDGLTDLGQELYIEAKKMIKNYIEKSMII